MKIFAVFGDSANQRALAHRIHDAVPLAHIAKIQLPARKRRKLIRSAVSITLARSLRRSWFAMLNHFAERFPDWPRVPGDVYLSANAPELVGLIEQEKPDLVLVSGTDLLRRETLQRLPAKVMNLHTGISPYIRGGPNCTNWALALGEFDLIGNTVMWIDAGIDTGAIISTERSPLTGHEQLTELHIKVMDHAHDLYRRAVVAYARGEQLRAVPQKSIAEGRIFLSRDWDSFAMLRAAANYRWHYRPFARRAEVKLIELSPAS